MATHLWVCLISQFPSYYVVAQVCVHWFPNMGTWVGSSLSVCTPANTISAHNLHWQPLYFELCFFSSSFLTVIIQTIQLFEHPLFQKKRLIVVFQAFEHPGSKLLFQHPNTYTLWSSNGGCQTSTSLRQPLWSYSESYRTSSSILQVFSNVY